MMRRLDHCVLPTADLAVARARLGALGFTVAPDAAHPFGTANCCVFLADDTYLEPLALTDRRLAEGEARRGNAFVARDRLFRGTVGDEGFSAIVLAARDAGADHARFVEEGISAGPALSFARPFTDPHGHVSEASFRLAFAAPEGAESFFFTCQRVNVPTSDRSALQRHENRVAGIARILMTAPDPASYGAFLSRFCESEAMPEGQGGFSLALANTIVSLLNPEAARHAHGIALTPQGGLRLLGIVFRAPDLSVLHRRLTVAGVSVSVHEGRLVVPPAQGQGAVFLFEEPSDETQPTR